MSVIKYRPDIDGLRAIAVIEVILFHLDYEFANGGFTGVDIFFVISGYLITSIIRDEVNRTGGFNYANFYVRRIRRLFPALLVTIIVTMAIAVLLFSPSHLQRAGGSAIHAISSLSNIYFWTESGYFDAASDVKPLLHTWSLSVEEQFYLIWPFLFVTAMRVRSRWVVSLLLVFMMLFSILLNLAFQDGQVELVSKLSWRASEMIADGKSTIFYLLPFRLYEFAIGGSLAFVSYRIIENRLVNEAIVLLGLIMIGYAFFFYTEDMIFPGYHALLPCLGAALMIYGGARSGFVGSILRSRLFVGTGLISYSLYLVHWPVIVLWKYYSFEPISAVRAVFVLATTWLLALLMYRYVEQPFRFRGKAAEDRKRVAGSGIVAVVASSFVIVVSSNIWANGGWDWRVKSPVSSELVPPAVPEKRLAELGDGREWINARAIGNPSAAKKVLVIGDSHAGQLGGAAKYLSNKYDLYFVFYTLRGCPPVFGTYKVYGAPEGISNENQYQKACRKQTKVWEDYVHASEYDYVILASRWNWLFEPEQYYDTKQHRDLLVAKADRQFTVDDSRRIFPLYLDYTIDSIRSTGAKPIVFGQVPHAGRDLEGCNNVPRLLISEQDINRRCNHVPREYVLQRSDYSNRIIKTVAAEKGATAVIPTDYFCSDGNEFCTSVANGVLLKNDDDHVNEYGSVFLARKWEASPDFPFSRD